MLGLSEGLGVGGGFGGVGLTTKGLGRSLRLLQEGVEAGREGRCGGEAGGDEGGDGGSGVRGRPPAPYPVGLLLEGGGTMKINT